MLYNSFKEAEEYLQYAFEKCDRDVRENKRSILRYLIPVKILLGQMPKQSLLQKFQLTQFSGVMEAVKEGHLANLNATLEKHEKIFIKWGIFLIQEKLKMITYRNLFKRVTLVLKNHQISIQSFTAALKLMEVEDVDDTEILSCQNRMLSHPSFLPSEINIRNVPVTDKKETFWP